MRKRRSVSTLPAYRFSLADLFDRAGRLRPLGELPPEVQAEIASFEIVRVTTRRTGETVITEELIRVKKGSTDRAGRTARPDDVLGEVPQRTADCSAPRNDARAFGRFRVHRCGGGARGRA
jgi:hypothetical protein